MRGAAGLTAADLSPDRLDAEQASVRAGQAGLASARRLSRAGAGVLNPTRSRSLPRARVPRAWFPGGVRGPRPHPDGGQPAVHGRPPTLSARPAGADAGAGPLDVEGIGPGPPARSARI